MMNFNLEVIAVICAILVAVALFASSEKAIREEVARRVESKDEEIAKLSIMSRMFLEELMFFRGYFLVENMDLPDGAEISLMICDDDGKLFEDYLKEFKTKREIPAVLTLYLRDIFAELLDNEELRKIEFNIFLDVSVGINEDQHFNCHVKLIERRLKDYVTIMDAISNNFNSEEEEDANS